LKWCLALTGNRERRQAPFFNGISDGTHLANAMARVGYHEAINPHGMVSDFGKVLSFNGFSGIFSEKAGHGIGANARPRPC
jgi:hypothetical protein